MANALVDTTAIVKALVEAEESRRKVKGLTRGLSDPQYQAYYGAALAIASYRLHLEWGTAQVPAKRKEAVEACEAIGVSPDWID